MEPSPLLDVDRPSFFEIAAQDQLRGLLAPVTRYILSVFAQRNPRYLLPIVNRYDEYFALATLVIERHYLKNWNASFAESFYNLKRQRHQAIVTPDAQPVMNMFGNQQKLRQLDIYRSLFVLVGVPYIRTKLELLFERLGGGIDEDLFADEQVAVSLTRREKAEKIYRQSFPYINTLYELVLLSYNAAYIFGISPFHSPWHRLMKIDIRRMTMQDLQSRPKLPTKLLPKLGHLFLESLRYALPTSIFLFKLLEWWYSSSIRGSNRALARVIAPPLRPPVATKPAAGDVVPGKGICPICQDPLVNMTVLCTSGWVFCYTCAFRHIEKHGKCFVTHMPSTTDDLRKLIG